MSVGNVTQAVTLNQDELTLVLGNNIDLGGDTSASAQGQDELELSNDGTLGKSSPLNPTILDLPSMR